MLFVLYLLTIVVLVSADQFSKFLVVKNISESQQIELIDNFFNLTYVKNYGAGFSILQNQRIFLIVVSFAAVILMTYLLKKSKSNETLNRICYLLIIGGAIGNIIDRIKLGYVIDFLDFYIFSYNFPVFNFADSCLTIGCFVLIISILLESKNAKH